MKVFKKYSEIPIQRQLTFSTFYHC